MAIKFPQTIWQEADLIDRFARGYRTKFAHLIDQLNSPCVKITDMQCLRLCVEAVDLMLDNQSRLAQAVKRLSTEPAAMKSAA